MNLSIEESKALHIRAYKQRLNERLKQVYINDKVKSVYAPFETLGKEIISKLLSVDGEVLVLSDLGLLVALIIRFGNEKKSTGKVTFVAHSKEQEEFARELNIKTIQIGYEKPIKELEQKTMGMKFDVIVGNPPFSENPKASDKLWARFIILSLNYLTDSGVLAYITPGGWSSSTNIAYKHLKGKISFACFADRVSKSFEGVGGSQRFTYFLASLNIEKTIICEFDEGEFNLDPTETPFAPQKSSSYMDFTISQKIFKSNQPFHNWKRVGGTNLDTGVLVPMAKTPRFFIEYKKDDFNCDRYKLVTVDSELGNNIAYNLNRKLYRSFRWNLRSGPALAGNFKLLPIPITKMSDEDLYKLFNLSKEEINHVEERWLISYD